MSFLIISFQPSRLLKKRRQVPSASKASFKLWRNVTSSFLMLNPCSDPCMETVSHKWMVTLEMRPLRILVIFCSALLPNLEENGSQRSITSKPWGKSPLYKAVVHTVQSIALRMLVLQKQRRFDLTWPLFQIHCKNISFWQNWPKQLCQPRSTPSWYTPAWKLSLQIRK